MYHLGPKQGKFKQWVRVLFIAIYNKCILGLSLVNQYAWHFGVISSISRAWDEDLGARQFIGKSNSDRADGYKDREKMLLSWYTLWADLPHWESLTLQTDSHEWLKEFLNGTILETTMSFKASGVMEFQLSYFKSWKMMLWKCCTQYASTFGKLHSGHRTGKGQFSFQSQRKAMPKNAQATTQLHSSHTLVK